MEGSRTSVLVVHGFNHDHHQMGPLAEFLALRFDGDVSVYGIDLYPADGRSDLVTLADQVVSSLRKLVLGRIEEESLRDANFRLDEEAPLPSSVRVHLVGFSMGGLVSRIAYQQRGGASFTKSVMAYLKRAPAVRDMRPTSRQIRSLHSSLEDCVRADGMTTFTQLWTPFDHLIVPATSGRLPVGTNRMVPVVGHNRLIAHPACFQAVFEAIQLREAQG
jgi:triacylglycerol lipase